MDEFILQTVKAALLGKHETTKTAVDAFAESVAKQSPEPTDTKPDKRGSRVTRVRFAWQRGLVAQK